MTFYESLGANAILAGAYVIYKVFDRCMHGKCRYNKEGGLDFDLGDPVDATTDMSKIAELLKSRSLMHRNKSPNTSGGSV